MKYFFISISVLLLIAILSGCVPVIHPKNKAQQDSPYEAAWNTGTPKPQIPYQAGFIQW